MLAANENNHVAVHQLLERGAAVDRQNVHGTSALMGVSCFAFWVYFS